MISIVVISKDEPTLDHTLAALTTIRRVEFQKNDTLELHDVEVVVVDSSEGRLDYIVDDSRMTWIAFPPLKSGRVSIPHQRNAGVRAAKGEIVVFTDAGCVPVVGWLETLVQPLIVDGEQIVTGVALASGSNDIYDSSQAADVSSYVEECPTINLAFTRSLYDVVGGFDESFAYGSDIDFSWRVRETGVKIRRQADAVVYHDWGGQRRQIVRAFRYGRARVRLYRKHRSRVVRVMHDDPMVVAYPVFLLGLPLAVFWPAYLLLLLIPMVRNRQNGPFRVVADHLAYGAGVLWELFKL